MAPAYLSYLQQEVEEAKVTREGMREGLRDGVRGGAGVGRRHRARGYASGRESSDEWGDAATSASVALRRIQHTVTGAYEDVRGMRVAAGVVE